LTEYRIDADHSNSHTAWRKMGSPVKPTPEQYATLEKAGRLERIGDSATSRVEGGQLTHKITLPRQAVTLVVAEWDGEKGM
jgi:xylan 1,4-beta-xylosidase